MANPAFTLLIAGCLLASSPFFADGTIILNSNLAIETWMNATNSLTSREGSCRSRSTINRDNGTFDTYSRYLSVIYRIRNKQPGESQDTHHMQFPSASQFLSARQSYRPGSAYQPFPRIHLCPAPFPRCRCRPRHTGRQHIYKKKKVDHLYKTYLGSPVTHVTLLRHTSDLARL